MRCSVLTPYLQVLDVFGAAELRQPSSFHQCKEVQEEEPVAPQDHVGPFTVTPEPVQEQRNTAKLHQFVEQSCLV